MAERESIKCADRLRFILIRANPRCSAMRCFATQIMKQEATSIRARLKTPRAAAIAGILFSVLMIAVLLLFRLSVRADPLEAGTWLKTRYISLDPCISTHRTYAPHFSERRGFPPQGSP